MFKNFMQENKTGTYSRKKENLLKGKLWTHKSTGPGMEVFLRENHVYYHLSPTSAIWKQKKSFDSIMWLWGKDPDSELSVL